ncbi:MAG: glycosyltransferase family 4 protein [Alphaproteobacteria bacterium]|nr:glycosyltransferase family 4 protein [Alphaproteobacteria bacterium]
MEPVTLPSKILFILKGYPRLSETFIAQEILELEKNGLPIKIISLRQPTDTYTHPIHQEIKASILYLPEYLSHACFKVFKSWLYVRKNYPGYSLAFKSWIRDFLKDFSFNRIRRFGQALVLVYETKYENIGQIHAHFLHTPASVAFYTSLILNIPWSCSAHAKDIWTTPIWEIKKKLSSLTWLVTCTQKGCTYLKSLCADPNKISLIYHGLDLKRFPLATPLYNNNQGSDPTKPVIIFSVGRLVDKKGYDDLLQAFSLLPSTLYWHFIHIGDGPLKEKLKILAHELGLQSKITWYGAKPQDFILPFYQKADIFVLASKPSHDGDQDGLPNVLMEAQSQGLSVLSTYSGGIDEFILDTQTGLLVNPNDPKNLAQSLIKLITQPEFRQVLGQNGQKRLQDYFSLNQCIQDLLRKFSDFLPKDL